MNDAYGMLGMPTSLLKESTGEAFLATCGGLLDGVHETVNRNHVPLMFSKSPICHYPTLFSPPSRGAHN